jgi:membrane protease YdiL (CAAX protease family)
MMNYLFLVLLAVVIPSLAWMGRRQIASGVEIPRAAVYGQALFSQALIGGFAFAVAWRTHTSLVPWFQIDTHPLVVALALLLLTIAVTGMLLGLRRITEMERRIFEILAPATRSERFQWVAICAVVGLTEEFVYRAVLPDVLQEFNDHPAFIIGVSSVVFGLAHLLQGWKGFAITALFAVPLHILVYLSGTLLHVIVIHFVYDVIAGFAIRRRLDQAGGIPAQACKDVIPSDGSA